jgi:hypothetical protein
MQKTFKFSEFLFGLRTQGKDVFRVVKDTANRNPVKYRLEGKEGDKAGVSFELVSGKIDVVLDFDPHATQPFRSEVVGLASRLVDEQSCCVN